MKKGRKTLTCTPKQKSSILKTLLDENETPAELDSPHCHAMPSSSVDAVKNFYLANDVSRDSPNANHFVTIRVDGRKEKMSVKHLLYPIKEVYAMFVADHPGIKISIAMFFKL